MSESKNKVNETLCFPTQEQFEHDLDVMLEAGNGLIIALIDLDRFDRINSDFSNEEGDRVLIETGRYLKNKLPESVKLYRNGGDEFSVIFMNNPEREDVFLVMEGIRQGYDLALPDGEKSTFTIGIACAPDDASATGELIRKADGAMYRGKLAGRNRVYLPREDKMLPKTTHYTAEQLKRLTKLSGKEGIGEAALLREALDALLKKYDV